MLLAGCGSSDEDAGGPGPTDEATSSVTATAAEATIEPEPSSSPAADSSEPVVGPDGLFDEPQLDDDGTPHLIPMEQIFNGGVPRDGIPSIDAPVFSASDEWDTFDYRDDGLVIGVEVDGIRRAYPFQVIVWHELVNDTFNGKPILVSYCPLCGTAIAFEREINGSAVEFGVSGRLYNSDLLMYDRASESLWSQITGTAVVGDEVGTRLTYYPSEVMTWADWQAAYPDSEVLTTDTGATRDYTRDPYGDYYVSDSTMFPVDRSSAIFDTLATKIDVTGVETPGPAYGAFVDADVREAGAVNEPVGDTPVLVAADPGAGDNIVVFDRRHDGQTLTFERNGDGLEDVETGSTWGFDGLATAGPLAGAQLEEIVPVKGFWFAWVAFHPETTLWQLVDE